MHGARKKALQKAFGLDEYGQIDIPRKVGGTFISRILVGQLMGCSICFPHGFETINSTRGKSKKCWKKQRKTQHKYPHPP